MDRTMEIKKIEDLKTIYLIKTFSRTKRKDYENYVINAIWQRLGDDSVKPVSQQYIYNPENKRRAFIDLYFPFINIGIECNEAYHLPQKNKESDKKREEDIKERIKKSREEYEERLGKAERDDTLRVEILQDDYEPLPIDVSQPYSDIEKQINEAVDKIKKRVQEYRKKNKMPEWILSPQEYFTGKKEISMDDNITFSTIDEVCSVLFTTTKRYVRNSHFTPHSFKGTILEANKVWFPHLRVLIDGKWKPATKSGYENYLTDGGKIIVEINNDRKETASPMKNYANITFIKSKDALDIESYRFIGIFEFDKREGEKYYYKRINIKCPLLNK